MRKHASVWRMNVKEEIMFPGLSMNANVDSLIERWKTESLTGTQRIGDICNRGMLTYKCGHSLFCISSDRRGPDTEPLMARPSR